MGQPRFITSAADKKGFLQTDKPVIAVSGRSNVGKSSFINMLGGKSVSPALRPNRGGRAL